MSKFESIEVDINPEIEFNIKTFTDSIEVQERWTVYYDAY